MCVNVVVMLFAPVVHSGCVRCMMHCGVVCALLYCDCVYDVVDEMRRIVLWCAVVVLFGIT